MDKLEHQELDPNFYNRADAHIHLSNDQLSEVTLGKVSASMMYATARFNSWVSACGFSSGDDMRLERDNSIEYFVEQYRLMLADNLDDYIAKFDFYMHPGKPDIERKP